MSGRIEKLRYLASEHAWYHKICLRLPSDVFDEIVAFCEENHELSHDAWTLKVNRLGLDGKGPFTKKHINTVSDILLACR